MITKSCGETIQKLLKNYGEEVKIRIVEKDKSDFARRSCVDVNWKEIFKDMISEIKKNDSNKYLLVCHTEDSIEEFEGKGINLIDEVWEYFRNLDIVKIDIKKDPIENSEFCSWIVARN